MQAFQLEERGGTTSLAPSSLDAECRRLNRRLNIFVHRLPLCQSVPGTRQANTASKNEMRLFRDGRGGGSNRLSVTARGRKLRGVRMEHQNSLRPPVDEALSRLAAIVESSDDAIVGKNLDGIITSWNQAATHLFGYEPEEIIGRSILTIIPKDLHPEEAQILRKIRAGEKIDHYETRRIRKDGQSVEVSLTISPIRDRNGKIIGSSKIARDISERKKIERRLIQSEKFAATGRMAALIAHEVNNPLDSVLNLVYLARTSVSSKSRALPFLLSAEKELERVSQIARQTLGYYRNPGASIEIRLEEVFDEILTAFNARLISKKISVDCEYRHRDPFYSTRDDLMQVFVNLISNSVEAMPHGGLIKIIVSQRAQDGIEISMHDTGSGIAPEDLRRVFEPFFTTKGQLGTGIGLWVARELVEKHGGSVSITSETEAPRNGTTVAVFFPFKHRIARKEDLLTRAI